MKKFGYKIPCSRILSKLLHETRLFTLKHSRNRSATVTMMTTTAGCLLNVLFVISLSHGSPLPSGRGGKVVMCYFAGDSGVRPEDEVRFTPEDLDLTICTHVMYNRAIVSQDLEVVPKDRKVDLSEDGGQGMYNRTLALKALKPGLKVFIDVYDEEGLLGQQVVSGRYSALEAFARNAADFVESHGFDGMNIRISRHATGLDEVLPIMHVEFVRRGFELMTFLLPQEALIAGSSDLTKPVFRNLDLIVVGSYWTMPFDYTAIFSLQARLESAVDELMASGIPPQKLVVAIPAFSVTVKLCNRTDAGINASVCCDGDEGMYHPTTNMLLYNSELRMKMSNASEDWVVTRDEESRVSYGHSRSLQWTSFEDPESVRVKAQFILKKNFAGAAIMNVDMEDFKGAFTEGGKTFPLTRAAFNALNGEQL
ncbi:chitinase-3-like protein 1 [Hetaerina americana]|uniref:chitinase-3-like protein 1 n=1 Tax=Hetaerina americana TaxID=62018 RepID=UPI003A7F4711